MRTLALIATLAIATTVQAQFEIQDSHSTASLRSVHSIGDGIAWASGTEGTILRTSDDGKTWARCATPPHAEKLDFRGIQALDAETAIAMSSGKGDLSRVYKTVDACKTWKLVFTNPDQDGFFDGIRRVTGKQLYLLGDPVSGKFSMFLTQDQGDNWFIADDPGLDADKGDGGFAASNSSLISQNIFLYFGTGGATSPHVYHTYLKCDVGASNCAMAWKKADVPLEGGIPTAGIFSLSSRTDTNMAGKSRTIVIAVGGDYAKPDTVVANAATSNDGGETWSAAQTPPHGYRSSIAYDGATNSWITTGPNGTDISRDDGKNWSALKPSAQDAPDADKNWNALSLPFVVGPKGRIGKLRPNALKP